MANITATNLAAISAYRGLGSATDLFNSASRRLSSGLRIETAADGPADLAKSQNLTAKLRSLDRLEIDNQESLSLVQTASSGIETIIEHLQTIRELAVSSASASSTTASRNANQTQYQSLRTEINSISNYTLYNGKSLLDGTYKSGAGGDTLVFQVGIDTNNRILLNIEDVDATQLGVNALTLSTVAGANTALTTIDAAIAEAQVEQAKVAAADERLDAGIGLLQSQQTAYENAISAIVDADLAQETVRFAKAQLLQQSASAVLAQANLYPQSVLAAILPRGA